MDPKGNLGRAMAPPAPFHTKNKKQKEQKQKVSYKLVKKKL
jgi:hypothetical protein